MISQRLTKTIIILSIFLTIGCTKEGKLQIFNDTNDNANLSVGNSTKSVSSDSKISFQWDMTSSIFKTESKDIRLICSGLYVFENTSIYTITAGETENVRIDADAGALSLTNNHPSITILGVYISPSSDATWGNDDLNGSLGPGGVRYWTLAPGSWDIRLEDANYYYSLFGVTITVDETYPTYFNPSMEGVSSSTNLKKVFNVGDYTVDRVQSFPPPYHPDLRH